MSTKNFAGYDKHFAHREILGQNKSVLLKNSKTLMLVCKELAVENVFDDLEYAARHGHILMRSRFFLLDAREEVRQGLLAVINKDTLSVLKLFAHNHRQPESRESSKLKETIQNIFSTDLLPEY